MPATQAHSHPTHQLAEGGMFSRRHGAPYGLRGKRRAVAVIGWNEIPAAVVWGMGPGHTWNGSCLNSELRGARCSVLRSSSFP